MVQMIIPAVIMITERYFPSGYLQKKYVWVDSSQESEILHV